MRTQNPFGKTSGKLSILTKAEAVKSRKEIFDRLNGWLAHESASICVSYMEVDSRYSDFHERTPPPEPLDLHSTPAQRALFTFQNDLYKTSISNNKAQRKENQILEDLHSKAMFVWTELFDAISPIINACEPEARRRRDVYHNAAERANELAGGGAVLPGGGGLAHLLNIDFYNRNDELTEFQQELIDEVKAAKRRSNSIATFRIFYDWLTSYCTGDAGTFMQDRNEWHLLTDEDRLFQDFELQWDNLLNRMAESGNPIPQIDRDFRIVKAVKNPHLDRWRVELENDLSNPVRQHTEASFRATCRTYLGNNPQYNSTARKLPAKAYQAASKDNDQTSRNNRHVHKAVQQYKPPRPKSPTSHYGPTTSQSKSASRSALPSLPKNPSIVNRQTTEHIQFDKFNPNKQRDDPRIPSEKLTFLRNKYGPAKHDTFCRRCAGLGHYAFECQFDHCLICDKPFNMYTNHLTDGKYCK